MKRVIQAFFNMCLIVVSMSYASANSDYNIRLAIFDNPKPDPSRNENPHQFINSYLAGINTAITVAASKGIAITEKEFFHENNLPSIVQQATNAKMWQPDVIIGLSTSNDFLMSKAFFDNQVILSISATDQKLVTLPKGFYSLGTPDTDVVNTNVKFIRERYPDANLFITATAESKESVDFADLLAKEFKKQCTDKQVTERKFLTDDIDHLVFSKFMAGYQKNDVIVVVSIGYDSAIELMNKISAYLSPINPVFITATDNWGNALTPKKMIGSYAAFRMDTLSGGEDTPSYKIFLQNYTKIYHRLPNDKISFVTYQAVMSFVEAFLQYPPDHTISSVKAALLNSYLTALQHHANWYRPPYYVIYKLSDQKEVFFEKLT